MTEQEFRRVIQQLKVDVMEVEKRMDVLQQMQREEKVKLDEIVKLIKDLDGAKGEIN